VVSLTETVLMLLWRAADNKCTV